MLENISVFDFELSAEDMETLIVLHKKPIIFLMLIALLAGCGGNSTIELVSSSGAESVVETVEKGQVATDVALTEAITATIAIDAPEDEPTTGYKTDTRVWDVTDAEIEIFADLPHGFGLGEGTIAEGWIDRAVTFWENQMDRATVQPVPQELAVIPQEYFQPAAQQGTLVDLYYDTYESFSYHEQSEPLQKHAVVYLPYGYSEDQEYDVFYLMHGGWSDETTTLGTPQSPAAFKNVIDHAIAVGELRPLIIVCPTYNNTNENGRDSDNFSLAMRLTENYPNELINDLIPAVEGTYSTYAASIRQDDLIASRDHRGFGGFSMGSVTTWRTFQYGLDYFHYFLPMSCGTSLNEEEIFAAAAGHAPDDYFVFVMTGTDDFAYSYDQDRTDLMRASRYFSDVDVSDTGNFAFHVKEGYSHDGTAAMEYTYNGLVWLMSPRLAPATSPGEVSSQQTGVETSEVLWTAELGLSGYCRWCCR